MAVALTIHGRGAAIDVPNRFEPLVLDAEDGQLGEEELAAPRRAETRYFAEHARTAIARNDSPDIPFEASINPYRGCEHGCSYCYARPFHEYLGLSAGVEFETKIFCKTGLASVLQEELAAPRYKPRAITMSGVTDPYQPIERKMRITRGCLEVLADCRHPVAIITKGHLVTRDLDLLSELAKHGAARVDVSVTSLDAEVSRKMEPRASSPARRLAAIEACARAGVPVGVLVGPVVPGLTDHELPGILRAAAEAGAKWAHFISLRLPGAVQPVFLDWVERVYPDRAAKILGRQREIKGGKLNVAEFGERFRGRGPYYEQLKQVLVMERKRLDMPGHGPTLSAEAFRAPARGDARQMSLFG